MTTGAALHEDRLWAALNRAWRPLTIEEFEWLSYEELHNAVRAADLNKDDLDWIQAVEHQPFELY